MTGSCFGEFGAVKSCWGYRLKVVRNENKADYNELRDKHASLKKKGELALPSNVAVFSFKTLQKATNYLNTRNGKGGFNSCYRGILKDGTTVSVKEYPCDKRLDFFSLMETMSRIRHRNVVECIGCCIERDRRIVVYEFVGEKSLDQLFEQFGKGVSLDWPTRASICLGIAHGLEYLHHGTTPRVVHRDIKPHNVLLDDKFNPKIMGFDIAHMLEDDLSHCSSVICGTMGYIDPEYVLTGRFSEKTDVYSFGVLLLEVITGRKNVSFIKEVGDTSLVDWVWELREKGRIMEIVDPTLTKFQEDELGRFIEVALFCVQMSGKNRPSMSEVLLMLSGAYDFSNKALEKPYMSNNYSEIYSPISDQISEEFEITAAASDRVSLIHLTDRGQESIQTGDSFKRPLIDAAAEAKDQMAHKGEIESESDIDTDFSEGELMTTSHDLETELYSSIERTFVSFSEPGTRCRKAVAPHDINKWSDLDLSVRAKSAGPSLQTSVNPEIWTSTSVQIETYTYNEAGARLSFQEDQAELKNEVLSLPKVTTDRPIDSAAEKIVETFRDDKCRTVCLHGRAGSGKTTVLERLLHHPSVNDLFDVVMCVTIPKLAPRQKIQNAIIQQLSLDLQYCKTEDESASLIHHALTGRKVLLLLDDVWEVINFHEVGIPNNCWLILSTRSSTTWDTLAKRKIEVEGLSTAEAWDLFRYHVGPTVTSQIEPYARAIVEECHGLPLILSAVGNALRSESSVSEWKLALTNFRSSDRSDTDNQYPLSRQIKYCYDRLRDSDVKTCFLYCALFPREQELDISLLVDCLVNEGLLGQQTVAAYRKGHDIMESLVKSFLLEAGDNSRVVKMHNVIRDSALAILSSSMEGYELLSRSNLSKFGESGLKTKLVNGQDSSRILSFHIDKYLTRAGSQIKEPPSLQEWEQATMMFLMDNDISTLPSNPICPNLVALCLQRNKRLRVIPESFFDGMCSLKILNLSKTRIKSLPDSVSNLKNLEVLILHDCKRLFTLPSSIGLLKSLEVLNLQGTELSNLPDTIGELACLKQLRVSFYGSINHSEYSKLPKKLIPDGMISRLDLKELGLFVHPGDKRWTSSAPDVIKQVKNLRLSSLFFYFPEVEHLELFLDENRSWTNCYLTTFNFIVGCDFKRIISPQGSFDEEFMYDDEERYLKLVNGENIPDAVRDIIRRVTSLYLDHHLSIRDLSEFGVHRMNNLKRCTLRDCPELLRIVHGEENMRPILPNLEHLIINHLWNLEKIFAGHVTAGSLARLKHLRVHLCPKLRHVFTYTMVEVLVSLEELVIEDCESLESIVIEDEKTVVKSPVLCSFKRLELRYLPKTSRLWNRIWPPVEYLSFYDCPLLKNLHMDANGALNIKEIIADKAWWDTLDWDDTEVPARVKELVSQININ